MLGPKITLVSSMYSSCRTVINNIPGLLPINQLVPARGSRGRRYAARVASGEAAPGALLSAGAAGQRKTPAGKTRSLTAPRRAIPRQLLGPLGPAGEGREKDVLAAFQAGPTSNSFMSIGGKLNRALL